MRVLWFSHISLSQNKTGKFYYPGGNWISSLQEQIENDKNIELGIVFLGDTELTFENSFGTKYYQLTKKYTSKINHYYTNWLHDPDNNLEIKKLLFPIDDFRPDIIHIFGTENIFGNIIKVTSVPVIIHLQGLITPYLNAWKFPGYKTGSLLRSLNWVYFIKGVGMFHDYFRFKKMARRELHFFSLGDHFMGRTHWDKAVTKLYSPEANYYHCDEVMRDCFYNAKWEEQKNETFIISSTINANIYKGLDLILKTARLLKQNNTVPFEWHVYGIKPKSEYARFIETCEIDSFLKNNIILKGTTLSEDLLKGLLKSNLFVHSSYIDNSPNSVCEAQLIGLPVISTNVGGISSLIHDEVDGFLVPTNEPHILVSKIIDLANNPDKLKFISFNSIETAHKRHDRKNIKENLLNIYSSIINRNKLHL